MTAARPNIVLFLTDDLARWALPVYGNPVAQAPALERLADRGTVFEEAFTPSPVCSPARASLMTGLMPSEHGIHDFLASNPAFDQKDWLAGHPTLAQLLAAAGYRCGLVGKWHVARDAIPQPGFESWYALNGEYPIHHDGDNGFSRNGIEERVVGNLTDAITAGALEFLERPADGRPFFLVVGYYSTHSPWRDQPARLRALYAGHDFAEIDVAGDPAPGLLNVELPLADQAGGQAARENYYAAVTHIDEGVAAILEALDRRAVADDTLVVYTADHGQSLGQHGVWGKGNATRPQNVLDDNIRVPLVMAGPGIPGGERRTGFVDHLDTHRAILGAAFGGSPQPTPHPIQFCEYGTLRMARTPTHKLVTWTTGAPPQLFSVGDGVDETHEITGEPGASAIVAALTAEIERFFAVHSTPEACGPAALARGRFNYNQAWDPFVPR